MQLILNEKGSSLQKRNNMFEVNHKEGCQRLPVNKVKSIVITKGVKLTADAIYMAAQNDIEIILTEPSGKPVGRFWSPKFGSISTIRRKQVYFRESKPGLEWVRELLVRKIANQTALLHYLKQDRPGKGGLISRTIDQLDTYKRKIAEAHVDKLADIDHSFRGWEGTASRKYWQCMGQIVPGPYQFDQRSKHPARDIFNSALNYLYGMLYGKLEGAAIIAGIDPYMGIFHRDEYNRPNLVFDAIEPFRTWADALCLKLFFAREIKNYHFEVKPDNGFWLQKSGKQVIIPAFNSFMEEVVEYNGKRLSRNQHIQQEMHNLAESMMQMKTRENAETQKGNRSHT